MMSLGSYNKQILIKNLDNSGSDIISFHAGTEKYEGGLLSTGGRILGVTATGDTLTTARESVYAALKTIDAPGTFFRRDIGEKAIV